MKSALFTRLFTKNVRVALTRSMSGYTCKDNIIKSTTTLEYPKEDLFTFFKKRTEGYGERTALVDCPTGKKMSFTQLLDNSTKLASFFEKKGYNQGDCVGIHVTNCIEYPVVLFGTVAKGMNLTTANPASTPYEVNRQLINSKPKVLFTNSNLLDVARKAAENTNVDSIISVDQTSCNDSSVLHLSDILEQGDENFKKELTIDPVDDVAMLLYSSGTTGLPKGVMLTHHNITCNAVQLVDEMKVEVGTDNVLCVLPMYHIYGIGIILINHLIDGRTIHTLPSFEPELFLNSIEKYKINKLPLVPPIALFMLKHPIVDKFDLSSIKHVTVGSAPMEENVVKDYYNKFPEALLQQGYGMTEGLVTHAQFSHNMTEHIPGSSGTSLPDIEWKVECLETGVALPAYEKGEICTRSPLVMKGYLNNAEATKNCITEDGWLHSGDLGYYDENYNLFVIDRLKELIKYKALQVAPAELEDFLLSRDDIIDSCVIGIPDERAGEIPRAFIVKTESSELTEDDVKMFMKEKLADHKQLRGGVQFVDTLPKSPSGKLLRRIVKDEYLTQ